MKSRNFYKNILIIIGLVSLSFFVAHYFVYQDIKSKNENITTLSQQIDLESSRQEYLLSTERMIKSIRSDIDKINNSIISVDGNVEFIEGLESVAKNNGLTITIESLIIEDDPAVSSNEITTLKVKARTKGGWVGTYTFLKQIESLPYKIKINQFSMLNPLDEASVSEPNVSEWTSTFEIRVLKYK